MRDKRREVDGIFNRSIWSGIDLIFPCYNCLSYRRCIHNTLRKNRSTLVALLMTNIIFFLSNLFLWFKLL